MARTGRFGRLPGPGFDYSSIVGSLLAQYENARNANILSAWRDGGMFEGKKVTDGRLLAWFKARRNEYDKDDPEWDKWNQQITQFKYDIAEQKMMLEYARQNIGEGAVSRWYANSAGQFPRNSQAWRDAMINAARYRKAAQEKAAAAARAAAANKPSRSELYDRETREVTRTHINPANQALKWWGRVLNESNVTNGGTWGSANIDALSGGHAEAVEWLNSEEPRAVALRQEYKRRYGVDFSLNHFMNTVKRGAKGSEIQAGIARKYKYFTAVPQFRENKATYNRHARRMRTAKQDRWTDYLEAQTDAEEAMREADTPEERERIRQELAAELAPIREYFHRRGEPDAAFLVGETIDAATGGVVSASADLADAPWGQEGSDPRITAETDPGSGQAALRAGNTFNASLVIGTQDDRAQIKGLRDGTYIRIRQEDGSVAVVPSEAAPDIASTHFLDNILDVTPGVTIDGKQYPARSNAIYTPWTTGSISVSDPDDPYTLHDFTPEGLNEFAVAETIDGELVYRYSKPDGTLYTGPIPPFDERIEVFGNNGGHIKVNGLQVRDIDPTFLISNNNAESSTSITQRAQATLGMGAGSRSEVFSVNAPPDDTATEPVTERAEPTDSGLLRLVEMRDAARAELAAAEQRESEAIIHVSLFGDSPVEKARAALEQADALLAGYKGTPEATRQLVRSQLEEAEAKVREFYDSGAERFDSYESDAPAAGDLTFGGGAGVRAKGSEAFQEALEKRDALVETARAAGIDVQVDTQEFFITGPGLTISTAVRTNIPEGAISPPAALVDKPPVYSPVLTQSDNPLAAVISSESQWGKLSTMSPHDARIVYDKLVVSNGWESDGAAKARLAHSFEAAFMAGEAGDTHLDWMMNYPGGSMQEAIEMSSRIVYFNQRRKELDDSGVDFWEGVDQRDLVRARKGIAQADPTLTGDDIDREFPWLASARQADEPSDTPPPPTLADVKWTPQTEDLETGMYPQGRSPAVKPKASRHITASELMSQHPDALQADMVAPPSPVVPSDFGFNPPDPEALPPSDYRDSRPSWVAPPMPTMTVPKPAAFDITKPLPPPVVAAPVSTAPPPRVTTSVARPPISSRPRML